MNVKVTEQELELFKQDTEELCAKSENYKAVIKALEGCEVKLVSISNEIMRQVQSLDDCDDLGNKASMSVEQALRSVIKLASILRYNGLFAELEYKINKKDYDIIEEAFKNQSKNQEGQAKEPKTQVEKFEQKMSKIKGGK